jgi:hypothetical protein
MVKRALLAIFLTIAGALWARAESLPRGEKFSLPSGTVIHCRITQTLTTKLNFQGESFQATVSEPILSGGREVIPAGATLVGRIASLQRPGRIKGVGEMRLNAETISMPDGRTFPVSAVLMTAYGAEGAKVVGSEGMVKGPNSHLQNIEEIGGGSAVGSLVGLILGHPWVGVAVGGTAGFIDRVRRGGKDLTLPGGTQLNYELTRPLEIYREDRPVAASQRGASAGH